MKIGVLGTGMVGQAIGGRLVELGHETRMGSRTADHPGATEWAANLGAHASNGTFADAASFGDLVFNCTPGTVSLAVLGALAGEPLQGKVLVDVSNALDFSAGFPPSLAVANTDSIGEQIQRALPDTRVVKALNTLNADLMVHPSLLDGAHDLFIAGDDAQAKSEVRTLLLEFGWSTNNIHDLGGIICARGTEMYLPL